MDALVGSGHQYQKMLQDMMYPREFTSFGAALRENGSCIDKHPRDNYMDATSYPR